MQLSQIIQALHDGQAPASLFPPLMRKEGDMLRKASGSYRAVVYDAGDYIVKGLQGRTRWDVKDDAGNTIYGLPLLQDTIPDFPPGIHPPEQYVVGEWLIQRKYEWIGWERDRLTPEEKRLVNDANDSRKWDFNLTNLGRAEDGRLIAFDW